MNKLLESAKDVLNQYSKSRSYLSADIDSDVMEALRQALADHIPDVGKMIYVPMSKEEHLAIAMQCMGADNWQQEAMEAVELAVVARMKEQGLV